MAGLVETAWNDLETWWREHLGEDFESLLNPGASRADFKALERAVGRKLPADFVAAYRRHDGQAEAYEDDEGGEGNVPGLFFGMPLLPLQDVVEELQVWREVLADLAADGTLGELDESQSSHPPDHVKPVYANPFWVPFARDGAGNHLAVDLDPDTLGTVGQVIVFGRDEDVKYVLAPSFGAYLRHVADELGRGNFRLEEDDGGDLVLTVAEPEGIEHYLDAVRAIHGGEEVAGRGDAFADEGDDAMEDTDEAEAAVGREGTAGEGLTAGHRAHIERIARALADGVDHPGWRRLVLRGRCYRDGSVQTTLDAEGADGAEGISSPTSASLSLLALCTFLKANPEPRWKTFVLTVERGGAFDVQVACA